MAASVDVSQVAQHVAVTQDLRIQPIVGTLVYEQLQDAVVAGTLSAKQRELLRRLRASLARCTKTRLASAGCPASRECASAHSRLRP